MPLLLPLDRAEGENGAAGAADTAFSLSKLLLLLLIMTFLLLRFFRPWSFDDDDDDDAIPRLLGQPLTMSKKSHAAWQARLDFIVREPEGGKSATGLTGGGGVLSSTSLAAAGEVVVSVDIARAISRATIFR